MMGCGQGGSCCGSCAQMNGFSHTEAALLKYAQDKLRKGGRFEITPQLSSDNLAVSEQMNGMGFFPALIAAVTAAAPTIANVAGTAAAIKGLSSGKSKGQVDPNAVASAILPQVKAQLAAQGINLPDDGARQITVAGVLDAFGTQNRPLVVGGLGLLAVVLLLKLVK